MDFLGLNNSQQRKTKELAATQEAYQQVTSKPTAVIDIDMAQLSKKPGCQTT